MAVVLVGWESYASKDDEQDGDEGWEMGDGVDGVDGIRIQMDKAKT
jgi:hypothetical protein